MKLGTHVPDGQRRKPIDIEVGRSKVKVTLSIHMLATRLSRDTDFLIMITLFRILSISIGYIYISNKPCLYCNTD